MASSMSRLIAKKAVFALNHHSALRAFAARVPWNARFRANAMAKKTVFAKISFMFAKKRP